MSHITQRIWPGPVCVVLFVTIAILVSSGASATQPREADGRSASTVYVPAALNKIDDCEHLRGYVTDALVDSLLSNLYGMWMDLPWSGPGGEGDGPSDYSTTNNQEDGVDEIDIVKTDGTHLFVASEQAVKILDSWPAENTRLASELLIDGYQPGLFLFGDRLAVISTFWNQSNQPGQLRGGTRLELVDVGDRSHPQRVRTVEFEGYLLGARMIDGHVYLVLRTWVQPPSEVWELGWRDDLGLPPNDPEYSDEELEQAIELARTILTPLVADIVADMHLDELLPLVIDSASGSSGSENLLQCNQLFSPSVRDDYSVLSVVHIDLGAADVLTTEISATGILTSGWTIYASSRNLYVAQSSSWWWSLPFAFPVGDRDTGIHKFALDPDGTDPVQYEASGTVPGQLYDQFAMGEHDGYLRVATDPGFWWWGNQGETGSTVTVLEDDGNGLLAQVGQVSGISPDEDLYATRFLGDRGYLITFERIDPLFTLDLSDPTDPRVVGELEIPGYSAYLHPMDQNHLLAVGMDGDEEGRLTGLAVKIFDVTDLEAPSLLHEWAVDNPEDGWSWSEALGDHHAFTFHRGVLAFPSVQGSWGQGWTAGLMVLAADIEDGLLELGTVDHSDMPPIDPSDYPWTALVRRSVFIEDNLFSISARGVKVNSLLQPEIEIGVVPFGSLFPIPMAATSIPAY